MTIDLSSALVFLLVMLRMTGFLVSNPILGRRGVQPMMLAGFALLLSVIITSSMDIPAPPDPTLAGFVLLGAREILIGVVASFIVTMFLSILVVGGEIIDMQLAMSMAKVFDPGTNASISLTSTLFNAMYILIFFATNNHLTLINLIAQTVRFLPVGTYRLNWEVMAYLPELFSTILIFAMKLCLPIIVVEIIVTMAVGIIMRVIPQINVFVVNIQFKLMIGFVALIVLVIPFTAYFENLIVICTERIQEVLIHFAV